MSIKISSCPEFWKDVKHLHKVTKNQGYSPAVEYDTFKQLDTRAKLETLPAIRAIATTIVNSAKAYYAALKVRGIDANAFAVLIGRVLEMICEDRKATGKFLHNKIADLATKGEIPQKLVGVANSLKNLRNIGAHATLGELTVYEIPILDDLCKAILEYAYSAPYLANQAESRLAKLKKVKSE